MEHNVNLAMSNTVALNTVALEQTNVSIASNTIGNLLHHTVAGKKVGVGVMVMSDECVGVCCVVSIDDCGTIVSCNIRHCDDMTNDRKFTGIEE